MRLPLPPFTAGILQARHEGLPYPFYASSAQPLPLRRLEALHAPDIRALLADLELGYAPTGGHPLLLQAIAELVGPPVRARDILTFPGAQAGIFTVLSTILREGDHVVAVTPCYPSLVDVPAAICEVSRVELRFEREWQVDPEEVEAALRPTTRAIVLNTPNSPTGCVVSRAVQERLVEVARRRGLWIFSDEVYRLLELEEEDRLPPMARIYERGISLGAMSKPFGLGGLLIGWVACRDPEVRQAVTAMQYYLSVCNPAVSELQAVTALRHADAIAGERRRICRANLTLLDGFFEEYGELFRWVRPRSGCVGYPRLEAALSVDELTRQLAEGPGILIMPARAFGHRGNFFRVGFGRTTMPAALERFTRFVEDHREGW